MWFVHMEHQISNTPSEKSISTFFQSEKYITIKYRNIKLPKIGIAAMTQENKQKNTLML